MNSLAGKSLLWISFLCSNPDVTSISSNLGKMEDFTVNQNNIWAIYQIYYQLKVVIINWSSFQMLIYRRKEKSLITYQLEVFFRMYLSIITSSYWGAHTLCSSWKPSGRAYLYLHGTPASSGPTLPTAPAVPPPPFKCRILYKQSYKATRQETQTTYPEQLFDVRLR